MRVGRKGEFGNRARVCGREICGAVPKESGRLVMPPRSPTGIAGMRRLYGDSAAGCDQVRERREEKEGVGSRETGGEAAGEAGTDSISAGVLRV